MYTLTRFLSFFYIYRTLPSKVIQVKKNIFQQLRKPILNLRENSIGAKKSIKILAQNKKLYVFLVNCTVQLLKKKQHFDF